MLTSVKASFRATVFFVVVIVAFTWVDPFGVMKKITGRDPDTIGLIASWNHTVPISNVRVSWVIGSGNPSKPEQPETNPWLHEQDYNGTDGAWMQITFVNTVRGGDPACQITVNNVSVDGPRSGHRVICRYKWSR